MLFHIGFSLIVSACATNNNAVQTCNVILTYYGKYLPDGVKRKR